MSSPKTYPAAHPAKLATAKTVSKRDVVADIAKAASKTSPTSSPKVSKETSSQKNPTSSKSWMNYGSLANIAAALANKEVTSTELSQDCYERIEKLQEEYNIFISVSQPEEFAPKAQEADALIKEHPSKNNTLSGIPYVLKDIFCATGTKTSCGSKMLDNFVAPYDATVVAKINQAHGVMMGKSNMDEFAMGSSNEHSYYGAVGNPWDKSRVTGGSSGGSAAAVAARVVPYALGTDTGGSVRQPASFCGVTGIKPTYGRVSRYGMIAYASSLDQAGVFSISAEDAAYVLNVISGYDAKDSTCANKDVPDYVAKVKSVKDKGIKGLKVGVPEEFVNDELDGQVKQLIEQMLGVLSKEGAEIVPIKLPNLVRSIPCYYTLSLAEASANLSRYDGVRYGHRSENAKDIHDLYVNSRSEGFGDEVKKRILLGTYVLTAGYYDAYYVQAQKIRRLIRDDFKQAFKKVDVIAGPVSPSTAFKIGEKSDPLSMYLQDIYTVPANLAGLPALSMPMGFIDGMPIGAQLLGDDFAEESILSVAAIYQELTNWHTRIPPLVAA